MLPGLSPATPSFIGAGLVSEFESPSAFFFLSTLFFQGGGMDLTRVGERLLSSVASGRSLGILPTHSDRPQIPARAAAAAAVARALAGLPPHQRLYLPSSSEELISIYGSRPQRQSDIEDIEEEFYEEDFDPVKHVLENMPSEGNDLIYFEEKANLRLAQLDGIAERLSHHVMEHHEEMVKGMQLVMELEQDLKVANVICMNGRRHLTSSMHEVSRDLVVYSNAKKKQALLDMLPILTELCRALDMRMDLDILVEEGNYFKAFQVLSEYLQVLDSLSELSAAQEMSHGVEAWLARTLQKLDSLLLGVCQSFKEESYLTALDAYAIIGDVSGLADKVQSFFMQEILSETHSILKDLVQEDIGQSIQGNRFTYSDLCAKMPESKFRKCLLRTMDILFQLMRSYYSILSFQPKIDILSTHEDFSSVSAFSLSIGDVTENALSASLKDSKSGNISNENIAPTPSHCSPFYQLRKDATAFVARTLDRGRKNFWQLTTSRMSVLLSCSAVCSTSTHQFLRNYEDIVVFILAGEAFCGVEAVEFRQRLKAVCDTYVNSFHRQNVYALKMVLEKETWVKISMDASQAINLAGLLGDGAPLIAPFSTAAVISLLHSKKNDPDEPGYLKNAFANWVNIENPFQDKATGSPKEEPHSSRHHISGEESKLKRDDSAVEDENEDLLADFIDEDSQLPSRMSKPLVRNTNANCNDEEISSQTGSSLCILRLMDKYARLMQKLEIVNIEFFKGICQLFGIFFNFVFEAFCQRDSIANVKGSFDTLNYRLKSALSKINQDCDQWIRQQNMPCSPTSPPSSAPFSQKEVTPTVPGFSVFPHTSTTTFGLKERCAGAETISLVARVLDRSRAHLQSKLLKNNASLVDDFYETLVGSVPALIEHIHRTTARLLLHINGYADRIANAKWEVKELGLDHNGYVDLLLGEFKHYKTQLAHGGIHKEVQDLLLEYGLENVADVLLEGLSRVKRCTDEGRALMSLDLQVLINGLQHFASLNVRPKLQVVETFIKAYYLPETEYVHWARSHPEYSKNQVIGLINLVASMKSWKRKTRLEVLERIEGGI